MHILLGSCGTLLKNGFLGIVSILGLLYDPNFDFLPLTSVCMIWADTLWQCCVVCIPLALILHL